MSEKLFALLLRLYPSHFRATYADEALQLFRDRARDEKGGFAGLRLWLDLLTDLTVSVARGHGHVQPDLIGASALHHLENIPSFRILGGETPRRGALLMGGLLSLVTLGAFPVSIQQPARIASGLPQPTTHQANPQARQAASERVELDAAERQRVIQAAIANLKAHYFDGALAQKMADALRAHEKNGDYDAAAGGQAFAKLLTRQLRDESQDPHLDVIYSERPLADRPPGPTPEGVARRYRQAMEQQNCTFEKVEMLQQDVGYLKVNSFPDPSICQATATATMASLNHARAIIFDLRDNGGGYPGMVTLIAGYLFDHPEYLYNPRENTTAQSWTRSPVPGSRLADKPVYLLTSARTASGAEQFAYNLKMLKRATLVGETTRGSAHSGVFYRIHEHFGMGIPEAKPINPFSSRDWEGTGVAPDVPVKAAGALEKAKELAVTQLRPK